MIINSSLPAESAAAGLRNSRATPAPAGSGNTASSQTAPGADLDGTRQLRPAAQDEDWAGLDPKAADVWTGFLQSNVLSQSGTALAAQANQDPDTVFTLLR
jgi:hypothetical protein